MFPRTLPALLALLAVAATLAACVGRPVPPQVASSPVAYARPTARTGAPPIVEATPVVATPNPAAAPAGGTAESATTKKPSLVKEPMVVVVPSYRLPNDVTLPQ